MYPHFNLQGHSPIPFQTLQSQIYRTNMELCLYNQYFYIENYFPFFSAPFTQPRFDFDEFYSPIFVNEGVSSTLGRFKKNKMKKKIKRQMKNRFLLQR